MHSRWFLMRLTASLLTLVLASVPASALTMERLSLKQLTQDNSTIVLGTVVDAYSYWNEDGSWIVTDIRVEPHEVLKGAVPEAGLTITVLGGTVGDRTVLIPGAPNLEMGQAYVLFVREGKLPGSSPSKMLGMYTQSVFDVVADKDGPLVISQAAEQHLYPDSNGKTEAVGGYAGIDLEYFKSAIRDLMAQSAEK